MELVPQDPSVGVIMAQGHIVFHFVYGIINHFLVQYKDEDSFTCFI